MNNKYLPIENYINIYGGKEVEKLIKLPTIDELYSEKLVLAENTAR